MTRHRIRPAFSIPLAPGPDEAMEVLRDRLRGTDYDECTRSKGRCAYFFVDEEERKVRIDDLVAGLEAEGPFPTT